MREYISISMLNFNPYRFLFSYAIIILNNGGIIAHAYTINNINYYSFKIFIFV